LIRNPQTLHSKSVSAKKRERRSCLALPFGSIFAPAGKSGLFGELAFARRTVGDVEHINAVQPRQQGARSDDFIVRVRRNY
jgi:hypothetical protein